MLVFIFELVWVRFFNTRRINVLSKVMGKVWDKVWDKVWGYLYQAVSGCIRLGLYLRLTGVSVS